MPKMEPISYFVSSAIVVLGIFLGVLLGYIAKEELRPGRKYLALMQAAILLLMVVFAVYYRLMQHIPVMLLFILLVWLEAKKITKEPNPGFYYVLYMIFAFTFFEASKSCTFIVFDSLIFLFGLPAGSLMFMKKKWARNSAALAVLFIVLSAVLFFLVGTVATIYPFLA
jgi:hypothetical protein